MGILDSLLKGVKSELKREARYEIRSAARKATKKAVSDVKEGIKNASDNSKSGKKDDAKSGKTGSRNGYPSETISFDALPATLEELQKYDEASLDTPFKTAALAVAVLCNFEQDEDATYEMLNFLKGPQPLSTYEKQFLRERLIGKAYVPRSYFEGTSPANNYTPDIPYTITISEDAYSHAEEKYCRLNLVSSGADNPRQIKLREKGGCWYLWEIMFLSDIRTPAENDPWAE